jgi:hypothetical protein
MKEIRGNQFGSLQGPREAVFMREKAVLCKLPFLVRGLFIVFLTLIGQPLFAQVDAGTITGTVKDESGSGVAGAKVVLINEETSFQTSTSTRDDGLFIFAPVTVGTYTVSVELERLVPGVQKGVVVSAQQRVIVDFQLRSAQAGTSVEGTANAAPVQRQDAPIGQLIGSRELSDLPLNGRNFNLLARLGPGVTFGQQDTRGQNASGSFTASGTRPSQNNYLLDGADNNIHLVDFLTGTAAVVLPPPEAIQEVKVQANDYSAELGGTSGAVLNTTTKSGTNVYHGSLWEFYGNDKLNAADFFENAGGVAKGEFRRNQFGGTFGGPVPIRRSPDSKSATFFFAAYQGTKVRQGTPYTGTVPTTAERTSGYTDFSDLIAGQPDCTRGPDLLDRTFNCGTIFDPTTTRLVTTGLADPVTGLTATGTGYVREPFADNLIPSSRLDASAQTLLDLYPTPTNTETFNNYTASPVRREDADYFTLRVDHKMGDQDLAFARFSYYNDPQAQAGPFPGIGDGGGYVQLATARNAVLSETHLSSPTLVNEIRLALNRLHAERYQTYTGDASNIPGMYGIPGVYQGSANGGLPTFEIGSLSLLGSASSLPARDFDTAMQAADNVTKIHGAHILKAGAEFQRLKYSTRQSPYSRGLFGFSGNYTSIPNAVDPSAGIAQFLLTPLDSSVPYGVDYVGGSSQVAGSSVSKTSTSDRRDYFSVYVQDDWRFRPRLTLNLGGRWEYFAPVVEKYGAQANFIPGSAAKYLIPANREYDEDKKTGDELSSAFTDALSNNGITLTYNDTQNPRLAKAQMSNISPRIGIAYQFSPKLVFRGGYGFFYGGLENQGLLANLGGNYPFQTNVVFTSPDDGTPIVYPDGSHATLSQGLASIPLEATRVNARRLMLRGLEYNYKTPYTQGINVSVQYQRSPHETIQLSYVGSLGRHLLTNPGLNEVSQLLPPAKRRQDYVPFQDFGYGSSYIAMQGGSYYHAFQLTLARKLHHGLSFLGNYTFSKTRTDVHDLFNSGGDQPYRAPYLSGFGIQGDYGLANFDIRHVLHFSGGYELPVGIGKRFLRKSGNTLDRILGGWSVNWILTLQGGQPVTIPCTITTLSGAGCYALFASGRNPSAGEHGVNQFWNPAAFTNPDAATSAGQSDKSPLGGGPTQVAGPGFRRIDLSLHKDFKTSERTRLELRAEVYNLTNHPNFALPTNLDFNDSTHFGQITSTRDNPNDARQIHFALKLLF